MKRRDARRRGIKCHAIRDQLNSRFGQGALPPDLETHVSDCAECRAYWNELKDIGRRLGADESFYLGATQVEELTASVMQQIDAKHHTQTTPLYRLAQMALPVAAALLLLLGISNLSDRFFTDDRSDKITAADLFDNDLTSSSVWDDIEMDNATFDLLLGDFASGEHLAPGELLLDDLTDDELEYLKNNLNIGELL